MYVNLKRLHKVKKIRIKSEPKHFQDVFVHVAKTTGFLQLHQVYTFVEYPDNQLLRSAICVDLQVIKRKDLTNSISFLDAQCDLDVYQSILDNRGLAKDQLLTVATFSHVHKSKSLYDVTKGTFNQQTTKKPNKNNASPKRSNTQPVLLLGSD